MRRVTSVHVLSWQEVDLAGVVFAGLIAGYVMAMAGLWAGDASAQASSPTHARTHWVAHG